MNLPSDFVDAMMSFRRTGQWRIVEKWLAEMAQKELEAAVLGPGDLRELRCGRAQMARELRNALTAEGKHEA